MLSQTVHLLCHCYDTEVTIRFASELPIFAMCMRYEDSFGDTDIYFDFFDSSDFSSGIDENLMTSDGAQGVQPFHLS